MNNFSYIKRFLNVFPVICAGLFCVLNTGYADPVEVEGVILSAAEKEAVVSGLGMDPINPSTEIVAFDLNGSVAIAMRGSECIRNRG